MSMKFRLTERSNVLKCYHTDTGEPEDNLYSPEDWNIRRYKINDDGTLDVYQYIDMRLTNIKYLPFDFRVVLGSMDISRNYLESLRGTPKYINGMFNCADNNLDTLEHGPLIVNGNYVAFKNKLKSLKHIAVKIGGRMEVSNNLLTNFEHYPKILKSEGAYSTFWSNDIKVGDDRFLKLNYYFTNV